jgi:DNA-binding response OmpR family regulator
MNKASVLIIENDSHLADIYSEKLSSEGFAVTAVKDGVLGLKAARKMPPDILVLDLLLPRKSGVEILKEFKQDRGLAKIPAIVVSNVSEKQTIDECFRLGAADFIIKKHINLSELVAMIRKALQ